MKLFQLLEFKLSTLLKKKSMKIKCMVIKCGWLDTQICRIVTSCAFSTLDSPLKLL